MDRTTYVNELHARYAIAESVIGIVIERATGRRIATFERLIRGDENEVHRIRLTDGAVVYLRVAWPGSPTRQTTDEAWAMEQAQAAGVPAPEVLATSMIESADGERAAMVLREVPGRPLSQVLPSLTADARSALMEEVGRTLRILHSITMPGDGRPDDHGHWGDPAAGQRRYLAAVREDTRHLPAAGLTEAEVAGVLELLDHPVDPEDPPVLCHGDLSSEHLFVDAELRIVGLIDWGQWSAGPAASDLADLAMRHPAADRDAVLAGYGFPADPGSRGQIWWYAITRSIGQIRWLVDSGQTEELPRLAATLRHALHSMAR